MDEDFEFEQAPHDDGQNAETSYGGYDGLDEPAYDNSNHDQTLYSNNVQGGGDLGGNESAHDDTNGLDQGGDAFAGMNDEPEPAHNALNKFHMEWETKLREISSQEDATKKTVLSAARDDHEKFVRERAARRETRMSSNRTSEQVFLEQLEADLESENPWERIVSLVDTQAEPTAPFKDTSRFKSIVIQLKNEPLKSAITA